MYIISICIGVYVFCFKQKTAYEMRISDWSSDVCSSDLASQRSIAITLRWRRSSTGASATCCKMTPLLAMNPPPASSTCIEQIERAAIQQALQENRYNKTKAAAALGITFRALRYKLKKLGID